MKWVHAGVVIGLVAFSGCSNDEKSPSQDALNGSGGAGGGQGGSSGGAAAATGGGGAGAGGDAGAGGSGALTDGAAGDASVDASVIADSGAGGDASVGDAGGGNGGVAAGGSSGGTAGTGSGGAGAGGAAPTGPRCANALYCPTGSFWSAYAPCDPTTRTCFECGTNGDCTQLGSTSPGSCVGGTCVDYTKCINSLDCVGEPDRRTICTTVASASVCMQCATNSDCQANERCYGLECRIACTSDNTCVPLGLLCSSSTNGVCVECTKVADCGPDQRCSGNECVPAVCVAGKGYCYDNRPYTCSADRSNFSAGASCSSGYRCTESGNTASCVAISPPPVTPPAQCTDGLWNGNETDVDCGGADCPACGGNAYCVINADCGGLRCISEITGRHCISCTDGVKNGNETDVDCGGGYCPDCADGASCTGGSDCLSNMCSAGTCTSGSCSPTACAACDGSTGGVACCKEGGACGCAFATEAGYGCY